ncbi:MAG: hypothetical protein SGJ01_09225 [Gemmatimonadota bacterium]|nr:hypothetical protein [Gemmatimonadota bacterium]
MTRRTRWIVVATAMALLASGGARLLDSVLERTLRDPLNNYLRDRTLRLLREERPDGLTITLPQLDLSLLRRQLQVDEIRIRYDHQSGNRYVRMEITAPALVLTGLDVSDLIWRRGFRLTGVHLEHPRFALLDEDTTAAADSSDASTTPTDAEIDSLPDIFPAPDSLLYRLVADWLPDDVREGRIEQLSVERATITSTVRRGARMTVDSTADLTLAIRGLELDSTRHRVFEWGTLTAKTVIHATPGRGDSLVLERPSITVVPEDTAYAVAVARTAPWDGSHALRIFGFKRSQVRQSLTADSILYAPGLPDSLFFRGARTRTTRILAAVYGLTVHGLPQHQIRQRQAVARRIDVDSVFLDVLADHRPLAGVPRRKRLWPARFAALDWRAGADTVVLRAGAIRYGEMMPGRATAATVTFDQIHATLTNATNRAAPGDSAGPVLMDAEARLFGQGALRAHFAIPVRPGPLEGRIEGRLGTMPLEVFDRFLLVANGVDIESGKITEADFWMDLAGGRVDGQFKAAWSDLHLRLVDPVTGKQNLGKKFKSMMAGMFVRSDNPVDKTGTPRTFPISYVIQPQDTFWGLVWRGVRSGIVKAMKQ